MLIPFEILNTETREELKRIASAIHELKNEGIKYPELDELEQEAERKLLGIETDEEDEE